MVIKTGKSKWGRLGPPTGEGNGTPLQYSCLESPMDRGPWWAAVHGVAKSRRRLKRLPFHFSLSCIGDGNGNPLQCSCLENPRDRGAWWAAVYGITQSQTRLKWLSSSNSVKSLCAQSCPTFCNSMDCILPGSSVHGILKARILEWIATVSSRGSSWPRD